MAADRVGEGRWAAIALAVVTGGILSIQLDRPGWFDNEGRFAEVAREMLLRADYVTPYLNDVPLLTKPPLTPWLAALVFHVTGPHEWGRLVAIAAAMWTLLVTCRLGTRLYGPRVGIVAGLMLATTTGFILEARTLRPDCLVIASVATAIWCWHVAETGVRDRRRRWLLAMYAVLGVGTLAKGLVPVVLAGLPIGVLVLRRHGLAGVRMLEPWRGLVVFAAIVLPWHVAAALANPGFAWDYVVNQHLLFAFDKKEPRDSEGDPLSVFLGVTFARNLPWVAFLPFTVGEAVAVLRRRLHDLPDGTLLAWTWCLGTVGLFVLVPSRLEHYTLPILPAVALLAARGWERLREGMSVTARVYLASLGLALVAGGVFGLARGQALLAEQAYWLAQTPGLLPLVPPASVLACAIGVAVVSAVGRRSVDGVVLACIAGMVPFAAILVRAMIEAEALFSWRPVAAVLDRLPLDTEIVFEAPIEYQIVGGLVFYAGRHITMLEPRGGYTPPTYLEGRMQGVFISRAELESRWRSERPVALVSDPQQRRDAAAGLVTADFHEVGHFGDRWIIANIAAGGR